jgi:hypothetical protein
MATLNQEINVTGNASKSIAEIRKELKAANSELIAAQANFGNYSKEALGAAQKVAQLKDTVQEARETADLFDPGKKFAAFTGALSAVASGFTAVQGAIGILGVKSEETEKTLLKVQSALALSQGLSVLSDSAKSFERLNSTIQTNSVFIKANTIVTNLASKSMQAFGFSVDATSTSFKVLKGAIAATGIGLLIVAIGTLVTAFQDYQGAAEKAKKAQDELNASQKKGADAALEAELDAIDRQGRLLVLEAKLRKESEENIFKIEQDTRQLRLSAKLRYQKEIETIDAEAARKNQQAIVKEQTEIKAAELQFNIDAVKRKEDLNKELAKKEEERTAKEKEELEKREQALRDAFIRSNNLQLQAIDNTNKAREEAKKKEEEDFDKIQEEFYVNEDTNYNERVKLSNRRIALQQAELEATRRIEDAKFAAASAGLNLLGALAGENEKLANALFVVDKALAVAKIVVDTQREIAGYWANPAWTILPDGGATIKSAATAAAKIRAAASIGTIAATTIAKFKGGSASANFGSGGAISTSGVPMIPQQQAQLTQLNQASINAIGNQAIRAYVVETDVTSNQQRIAAIKQRARFG